MPNSPEMSRFLYTILKQLDLKSINWAQVSSELGITNGHAARMRYSRFKQQMEGTPPVRRTRNPAVKRAPRQKRPKTESKDLKVKTEQAENHDSMGLDTPSLSPSLSMPSVGAYPDHTSMTPEAVSMSMPTLVKPEPSDDISSSASSLTRPEMTDYSRNHSTMPSGISSPSLAEQQSQPDPQIQAQTMADFHYGLPQQQRQQQQLHHQQSQRMFQHLGEQHVHDLLEAQGQVQSQNLAAAEMAALIETRDRDEHEQDMESMPFLMDMYHHPLGVADIGAGVGVGCHGNLMGPAGVGSMESIGLGPMVKVEERWDSSYGR